MKTINETFTEEDYKKLLRSKKKSGMKWHDFFMTLTSEDPNEKETKFRELLNSKITEYREKEEKAIDSKDREYNAVKWAYISILEDFDRIFEYKEQEE